MNVKLLMLPLFLTGALLIACDDKTAATDSKAADAKAAANKDAADVKAAVNKDAADAKAAADKAAANAKAAADKAAADAKTAADKASAEAARSQASKLLTDLQTAVTGQKWVDAGAVVKQLDGLRDKLAPDQKAAFDSLKKQYDDNKR